MKASSAHWARPEMEKRAETSKHKGQMEGRFKRTLRAIGRALLNRLAPIGYEDEQGFHYGDDPHLQHEETERIHRLN